MKNRSWSTYVVATLLLFFVSSANADEWTPASSRADKPQTAAISDDCAAYGQLIGSVSGPGDTNGQFGNYTAGDSFEFIATGSGTGTWRIVGDPDGVQTLASGGTFPGTLTYTVPVGTTLTGAGFYVDSYTGPGDTIFGTCGDGIPTVQVPVPATSFWSLLVLVMLLGLVGFVAFRRMRV